MNRFQTLLSISTCGATHRHGVAHRDLKLENTLIDGRARQIMLATSLLKEHGLNVRVDDEAGYICQVLPGTQSERRHRVPFNSRNDASQCVG